MLTRAICGESLGGAWVWGAGSAPGLCGQCGHGYVDVIAGVVLFDCQTIVLPARWFNGDQIICFGERRGGEWHSLRQRT